MSKIIRISVKCSDMFDAVLVDTKKAEKTVGTYSGYVPSWFPNPGEQHFGDYVQLNIDVESGRILNWKKPTAHDLQVFKD